MELSIILIFLLSFSLGRIAWLILSAMLGLPSELTYGYLVSLGEKRALFNVFVFAISACKSLVETRL